MVIGRIAAAASAQYKVQGEKNDTGQWTCWSNYIRRRRSQMLNWPSICLLRWEVLHSITKQVKRRFDVASNQRHLLCVRPSSSIIDPICQRCIHLLFHKILIEYQLWRPFGGWWRWPLGGALAPVRGRKNSDLNFILVATGNAAPSGLYPVHREMERQCWARPGHGRVRPVGFRSFVNSKLKVDEHILFFVEKKFFETKIVVFCSSRRLEFSFVGWR